MPQVTAHRISNGSEPSPAASKDWTTKEYGQSFSISFCPIAKASTHSIGSDCSLPTAPIVVLGGVDDEGICKTAMLRGAQDYLLEGHIDSYSFARAIRNIIEREIARQELFIEKERAQVTLNSIGDAVLSTDISGNVTYLNVVAEHMTGWSSEGGSGPSAHRRVPNHRRRYA